MLTLVYINWAFREKTDCICQDARDISCLRGREKKLVHYSYRLIIHHLTIGCGSVSLSAF